MQKGRKTKSKKTKRPKDWVGKVTYSKTFRDKLDKHYPDLSEAWK